MVHLAGRDVQRQLHNYYCPETQRDGGVLLNEFRERFWVEFRLCGARSDRSKLRLPGAHFKLGPVPTVRSSIWSFEEQNHVGSINNGRRAHESRIGR
jgi:hypothetical protein